jgi:hypothetical protein
LIIDVSICICPLRLYLNGEGRVLLVSVEIACEERTKCKNLGNSRKPVFGRLEEKYYIKLKETFRRIKFFKPYLN